MKMGVRVSVKGGEVMAFIGNTLNASLHIEIFTWTWIPVRRNLGKKRDFQCDSDCNHITTASTQKLLKEKTEMPLHWKLVARLRSISKQKVEHLFFRWLVQEWYKVFLWGSITSNNMTFSVTTHWGAGASKNTHRGKIRTRFYCHAFLQSAQTESDKHEKQVPT